MNIEHPDQTFINLEARPPAEKEPLILPDYPEELKFSPLFSDADTLGGQWDIQNDDLLSLTLEPREIKAAAANLQWLAFQENLPLEEIAPVADLYRDTYSKEWFGGTVENELQFYDAIALRLKHQEEEEDRYDEEIIENTWRTEHPKLDFALKVINSTLGTVFNGLGVQTDDEPLTRAEQYQSYRSSVSRLADLNPDSFNPSQAFVHDDGDGRLVLNPEGIGGLFGGFILGGGTNFLARGPRVFSIRKTIGARITEAKKRLKAIGGVTYDPNTKAIYDGNRRIPDEEISEHIRSKASDFPIILHPKPPLTSANTPPLDTTPKTRALPDRNIERYDGATDTFHDRGNVIAGKDIEAYLTHRSQNAPSIEKENNVTAFVRVQDNSPLYPLEKLPILYKYLRRRNVELIEAHSFPHFTVTAKGPSTLRLLRSPTILSVKHELCHYLDFKKLGFFKYKELTRKEREMRVLKRLRKNRIWRTLDKKTRTTSIKYAKDPDNQP